MRKIPYILLATLWILSTGSAFAQFVDAGRGELPLTVPSSYDIDIPTPLIVLLHGYTSSGAGQDAYMKFSDLSDHYGFLLVAPDGTQEESGRQNRFWNASSACCNFGGSEVDDSAYIANVIDTIKAEHNVDEQRVFLIGHSNGGFMSYRLAHDHPGTIAAIASLAGADQSETRPTPSHPVHVLQIHGTADQTIAYAGAEIQGTAYPGAVETVERWAAHNGCDVTGFETGTLDLERELAGMDSTVMRYTNGCRPGGSAELWTIADGSHVPELSDHFSKLVVEWLLGHPKP
jgi:polyhydroxybutyrate depolymerase